jgi:hypothetical protein
MFEIKNESFQLHDEYFTKKIYKTMDYNKFKILESEKNRSISEKHVNMMAEALLKENFLVHEPITVSSDYYILDGQHRYFAASRANVEIYYEIDPTITMKKIMDKNAGTLHWHATDYLNYYASIGNKSYLYLKKLMLRYDNCSLATIFLAIGRGTNIWDKFRKGDFVFDFNIVENSRIELLLTRTYNILNHLKEIMLENKEILRTKLFQNSVLLFLKKDDVDYEFFIEKLNKGISKLRACTKISEYHDIFVYIYNFNSKKKRVKK